MEFKDRQSRTEKILIAELINLGLYPIPQYKLSRMHIDIAFPEHKLAIEVNGVYHDSPLQKKKDYYRYKYLKSMGWQVMNFSAEKVHKYSKFCAEKIKERIYAKSEDTSFFSFLRKILR